MKKKIAVFGNGWSEEYLRLVLNGIQMRAADGKVDIYTFINYSSDAEEKPDNQGEKSIFLLPDLTMFDGIVLLTNTMNLPSEREYFCREIKKHRIPAVSLEYELEGIPSLGTDTYSGVYGLTSHIIKEHGARHIVFVSGPQDNQESLERMRAVNDALAEIGEQLAPEDILFGNWSYYKAMETASDWLKTNSLPDAFVCANDEMAVGVCSALEMLGVNVPQEVIVTGCDCIDISQKLYPILSTVAREWDKLGYDALDLVLQQIDGAKITGAKVYKSKPVFGESCGCKVTRERQQKRRSSIIGSFRQQKANAIFEWHLRHMDDTLTKLKSLNELREHWSWNLAYNHEFEGKNLVVCLVEDFVNSSYHHQFTPRMENCFYLKNGEVAEVKESVFKTTELLPEIELDNETSNTYLFMPLHIEDEIIGYVAFIDNLSIVYDMHLYTWLRHVSQDLERVRQNICLEDMNCRLMEASLTDPLTGLRNRAGYDALAVPYLQRCQKNGENGVMIFADINRMKQINDKYGHLQGDIAICTVAEAIKATMPKDWVAVRFGGDEFILTGKCRSMQEAEDIRKQIAVKLEEIKTEKQLVFPLSVSLGAVIMHPDEHYSLEEYLRKADEEMYIMKEKVREER